MDEGTAAAALAAFGEPVVIENLDMEKQLLDLAADMDQLELAFRTTLPTVSPPPPGAPGPAGEVAPDAPAAVLPPAAAPPAAAEPDSLMATAAEPHPAHNVESKSCASPRNSLRRPFFLERTRVF